MPLLTLLPLLLNAAAAAACDLPTSLQCRPASVRRDNIAESNHLHYTLQEFNVVVIATHMLFFLFRSA